MADAPSPTGTPVIPPRYVPLLTVVLVGVNAALVALAQSADFSPTVKLVATLLLNVLGPVLAVLSPGWRKPDGGSTAPLAKALGNAGSVDSGTSSTLSRAWRSNALERSRLL